MNFYQHHIGDFNNATRHLTRVERSIYRDLLELYYDSEKPLMVDFDKLARRCLVDDADKAAMRDVLNEFFELQDDGYHNTRADREIEAYQRMAKGGRDGAAKRWAKGSDRVGIAPPLPPVTNPNANHEPVTMNHEPCIGKTARGSRLPENFEPDFQFAIENGIQNTLEEASKFRDYWRSQPGSKGVKLDWPATWRNWCRNAKPRASPYAKPDPTVTVPSKPGVDPALAKAIKDSLSGAKPSAEIRQKMAQITGARA